MKQIVLDSNGKMITSFDKDYILNVGDTIKVRKTFFNDILVESKVVNRVFDIDIDENESDIVFLIIE